MLSKVRVFFEMIKFEHSVFALPFAYLGLFLASGGLPGAAVLGWVTGAMVSFRTSAMALNRLIDQEIDARNPRTRNRALPAGTLRRAFVWLITAVSLGLFALCAYQLNPLCFSLCWIPIALAGLYPFCKRFTWTSHFLLGGILGLAPYGAWLAAGREFSWIPAFLMIGVMAWVAGFDIIYALQDRDFDRQSGLYSFPACYGEKASLRMTRFLHGAALAAWGMAGFSAGLGVYYFAGLILAAVVLVRENWLVQTFGLKRLEQAFFTLNAVVSISLFIFLWIDLSL
jgi:4-hydroxybenzoate polyprenyltransferase